MSDYPPGIDPIKYLGETLGVYGGKPAMTQRQIARALCFAQLDLLKDDPRYQQGLHLTIGSRSEVKTLYEWLQLMLDATYPEQDTPKTAQAYQELSRAFAAIKDQDAQNASIKFLTRVGHLHQLAGLIARDNLLQTLTNEDGSKAPSTATAFLDGDLGSNKGHKYKSAEEAVRALNKPQFEFTFTAHPTSTSAIPSMQEQRELGQLLRRWRKGEEVGDEVKRTLKAFGDTRILPMNGNEPRNINVREETDYMLYYLGNTYQDMGYIYASYDNALGEKFKNGYDPTTLKLNVKFHSWGSSGDKDGNKKVNAETTLYALAAHHYEILHRYVHDLKALDGLPGMAEWKTKIAAASHEAEMIHNQLKTMIDHEQAIPEERFDAIKDTLKRAISGLDRTAFEKDLEAAYHAAPSGTEQQSAAINLLRRVRTYGFSFGTIEYRETAEEFERVVAAMIPEYDALMKPTFAARDKIDALKKEERALVKAAEALPPDTSTATLKEAWDKAASVRQQIEDTDAWLYREIVAVEPKRQNVLMHLLNDPAQRKTLISTFRNVGNGGQGKPYSTTDVAPISYHTRKRMELARDFPNAIQNQVLAECQQTSNMLEALLLQHAAADAEGKRPMLGIVPLFEDGDRLKAASSIIHDALEVKPYSEHIAAVAQAQGNPPAQQVQLAHSDNARRNGMPAARGLIFQAHQDLRTMMKQYPDIKLQFYEGGSQSDPYRGGARSISATVNEFGIHDFTKMTYQGGDLLNYLNQGMSFFRLLTRNITYSAAKLENARSQPKPAPQERKIVTALDNAKADYVQLFMGKDINNFMKAIGYLEEASAGANGSRATQRSVSDEVDVMKIRTITYSETLQHAGLSPTWLGTLNVRQELEKALPKTKSPEELHKLYASSPVLKDVIDRTLFGIVRSDLDYLDRLSNHHPLMDKFRTEYAAAFKFCYEAYTGEPAPELTKPSEIRHTLIHRVYPHMEDVLGDQDRFLNLVRGIKLNWLPESSGNRHLQRQLMHNAMDTIYHGRLPLIDDTTYLKLYKQELGIDAGHDGPGQNSGRGA